MPGTHTNTWEGPYWYQRSGSVLNCTDPMRIWGPHKKIPESGFKNPDPEAFALSFGMIRGSGLRPDPESFCVSCLMYIWWIRIQESGSGFASHTLVLEKFKYEFFRRNNADPRLPLSGSAYILCLVFTEVVVPVWGLRRGSGPKSGSARPPSRRYRI